MLGSVTVFTVRGRLTASEGDSGLRSAVRAALDDGARTLLLNLQDVAAVDSSGVSALASSHRAATQVGGRLMLCNLSPKLKDVLAVTRLDKIFDTYETEADALATC